jgi:hypothetical protein
MNKVELSGIYSDRIYRIYKILIEFSHFLLGSEKEKNNPE